MAGERGEMMKMEKKILLVDDEKDIVNLMEEALQKEGFHLIEKAYTGADTLKICRDFQPDVIVLDIMLPDIDGLEVCKLIRAFSYCSILFLSSRNDDVDKILGFSCGGDDYITKPFSPREVVFRVKAQLRRQQYQTASPIKEETCLTVGPLLIDKESSRAYKAGREIELTGREFFLLTYLMENADKIISKERLYEQVWGEYSSICDNTIMVHMKQIVFVDAAPQIKQTGLAELQDNGIGIQLLDASGQEVFSYQKPEQAGTAYSGVELLELYQKGRTESDGTTALCYL